MVMHDNIKGFNDYGSTVSWKAENDEMIHPLRYAHSANGTEWVSKGSTVPFVLNVAQAFSRPTVLSNFNGFGHLWFHSDLSGRKV